MNSISRICCGGDLTPALTCCTINTKNRDEFRWIFIRTFEKCLRISVDCKIDTVQKCFQDREHQYCPLDSINY